ncbi:MAG: hypothetical protein KKH70_20455 [Gammaproteobacteria bacterium]|nr:hypothetical protein [Gammaproteobacteria bacterium]
MAYHEINPLEWKYEKAGDFIEGVFVQVQSNIGPNDSMLYSIETPEGVKNVWGATILDQRMALVNVGEKIKITYQGKAEARAGKNAAKIFKVEVDKEDEVPVVKVGTPVADAPEVPTAN